VAEHSAGILLYRRRAEQPEVLLVHPGGPFWQNRDTAAWSIPKGLVDEGEPLLAAARREFQEETGFTVEGPFLELGKIRQPSGKIVHVWAAEGDLDPAQIHSNTFELEWPRHSGRLQRFPEVDRAAWFDLATARDKIHKGQRGFLERLEACLADGDSARE